MQRRARGSLTYEIAANWKIFAENALECCHCPLVHNETFAHAVHTDQRSYQCSAHGLALTQVAPIRNAPETDADRSDLDGFRLLYVRPSSFVSVDEYSGIVAWIVPDGPSCCRFIVDAYANPGADPHAVEDWMEMYNRTFIEDKLVVDRQQAGYATGLVPAGRLITHAEASIVSFQKLTAERLELALAAR